MDERAHPGLEGAAPAVPSPRSGGTARAPWLRAGGALVKVVAAAVSAAVVATTGYGWWTFGDIDDNTVTTDVIDAQPGQSGPEPLDGAVDILLVGIDSRTDAYGNPLPKEVLQMLNGGKADGERNTDTMILVHIPMDGRRAIAFSFPRDSWVDVGEGFGKHKLNSAFVYAYNDARRTLQAQGVTDPAQVEAQATVIGRKNLISTIQRLVGPSVTIDRYAEVNLASFYEVTTAVGGVEVCLNNPVNEWRSGANFPAGRQTISGAAALSFVRQRYDLPNGDLDRIVRQQVFLGALADKVLSADMLTDPTKARQLVSAVQKSVVLSSNWNLTRFAAQMQGLTSGNIEFRTIPNLGDAKIGGADVIRVEPEQVQAYISDLTASYDTSTTTTAPPPPSSSAPVTEDTPPSAPAQRVGEITVEVRNGSTTRGLATTVLDVLTGLGFRAGGVGDEAVRGASVIRYAAGELAKAQAVASSLAGRFSYEQDDSLPGGRVRVVLGTDYRASGQPLGGQPPLDLEPTPGATSGAPDTTPPAKIDAGGVNCVN